MRVEALRDEHDIEKVKRYFKNHNDKRLYPLLIVGLNTGIRISDLVKLKVKDFRNRKYLIIDSEEKTEKRKEIIINQNIKDVIQEYYSEANKDEYLFKSQKGGHICTDYAYFLIKKAFKACKLPYNTGTHTLRKTHGKSINEIYGIEMTQIVLGHDNQRDTLKYIGKEKEMVDKAILNLNI
ncbi:MAG: tyrosine-type recombinase/integrase [Romboutsia sp.]